MAYKLQLRRDTAANWTSVNPTLGQGEPGLEIDTGKVKYGDGTTAWNSLAYGGSAALATTATNVSGGTAGQLHYQSAPGITGFVGPGTAGQLLVSSGTSAPTYTNTGSVQVGFAATAGALLSGATLTVDNSTAAASTSTGALQVVNGGMGIGGSLYVGGSIMPGNAAVDLGSLANPFRDLYLTSGTLYIGSAAVKSSGATITVSGSPVVTTSTLATSIAAAASSTGGITATSILNGTVGQIIYQSAPSTTGFVGPGTAGQLLVSAGAAAPVYTNTGSIYVNSSVYAEEIRGGTAGQLLYQSAANVTDYVGPGTAGQLLVSAGAAAPQYTSTGSVYVGFANKSNNIIGGTAGQLVYNSGADTTAFVGPGTAGQLLVSAGAAAPTYTSTGSLYVGNAAVANTLNAGNTSTQQVGFAANVLGGAAGSIHYQTGANATSMLSLGTTGQILTAGSTAPQYTSTGSVYVGFANKSNNIIGGTAGQLVYNSGADTTSFVGPGTAGQILVSAGTTAPVYTSTGSIYVNRAVIADSATGSAGSTTGALTAGTGLSSSGGTFNGSTGVTFSLNTATLMATAVSSINVSGGTTGQIVYQSGAGATSFVGPGTAGQLLVSAGAAVPVYTSTGSVYVGFANKANNIIGGTAGQLVYNSGADTTAFVGPGTAGQLLVSAGAAVPVYTSTGSLYVGNAATANILNAGNTSTQQVGFAANVLGGAAGSIHYQSSANATAMLAIGGASSILVSNGSVPSWSTSPTIGGDLTITGNLTVQGTTTAVNSTVTNVSDPIVTLGGGAGGTAPASNDGKDRGIAFQWHNGTAAKVGFFGYKNSTGKFTFIPDSTNANEVVSGTKGAIDTNLAGGTAGQLVYQSAADTTTFVGPGTAGQILVSAGTAAPVYTSTASIYVNSAVNANNIIGGTTNQIHYQTGAGATGFVTAPVSASTYLGWNGSSYIWSATTGPQGPTGAQGATGAQGTVGTTGNTGAQGATGAQGTIGTSVTGAQGATGQAGTVSSSSLGYVAYYTGAGTTVGGAAGLTVSAGTTGATFTVNSTLNATGEITAYSSDKRLKTNVKSIDNAAEKVLKLTGITYTWNELANRLVGYDTSKRVAGLFAQDVEAVLPEAVKLAPFDTDENENSKSGENYLTIQYEKLIPLLVEAIKDQQQQISELQDRVTALSNR